MLKLGKVEKFSFRYTLLKVYGKFVHDKIFYKNVKYDGIENIPKDKPVLIAPNHQNALMDALAVIFALNKQVVFLARSDIFKNPFIAKLLFFLKILPVFRMRDGKEKLKYNEQVYEKTIQILKAGLPVVIFPEAKHIDKKHLRKLKKGIQRVAFKLENDNDFNVDVQIIPTGIYYSNYWNFRSKLYVSFGKPISVKDFEADYKRDSVKAMVKLGNLMHERISEQIINIKGLETHDEYDFLLDVCDTVVAGNLSGKKLNLRDKIITDKETVRRLDKLKKENPEKFKKLLETAGEYKNKTEKLKLKDWVIEKSVPSRKLILKAFLIFAGFPIYLYGAINNIIPYLIPRLITSKLKDRQFESSILYGLGIFSFPLFYILQSLIVRFVSKSLLITGVYFLSLPIFGLLAFIYSRLYVKTLAQYRFNKLKQSDGMKQIIKLREDIISEIEKNK